MNNPWAIRRLVAQIKEEWRKGETPDAEAALAAHPQLRRWKSIVLDLAFEEFHLRTDGGQELGPGEFCRRFPEHQRSLLHRIDVEQHLRREEEVHAIRWPEAGEEFLGYRLLEELGKGAVGRVFLARQVAMRDRRVVVKITPRGLREAHTLALLNHPHIVPVYRCDEDPKTGLGAICMPYVGRVTMEDLLVATQDGIERDFSSLLEELQRRFPDDPLLPTQSERRPSGSRLEGMLRIGRQIAEALAHTHERGVLHLDLKPSNVLLQPDGKPLLLDFNLSLDGAIGASVIGGTLPYMSPEQLQETILGRSYSSRPVDGRSDVFSLGVMLYELISGRHPFGEIHRTRDPREAAKELLRRHERGPAPWPESAPADREVIRFLDACLAYHPDQRPQSASEAAAALERFLSPRVRIHRWVKRRRKALSAIAAAAVIAVASLAGAAALAPPESERHLRSAQAHLAQQDWKQAEVALKASLSGDDQSALAWELLGQAQREQNKHREAFDSFHRAFAISDEPRLLEALGDCKLAMHEFELASGWYQKAIRRGVQAPQLLQNLGESLRKQNLYEPSQTSLEKAIEISPASLDARRTRLRAVINKSLVGDRRIDESELDDARAIFHNSESSSRDLYEAAIAFARASHWERHEAEVRACLQSALDRGLGPERLRGGVYFEPFAKKDWFRSLVDDSAVHRN
jgi:serine/threonine protein kinase/Tfp pilus assembly protein PilF